MVVASLQHVYAVFAKIPLRHHVVKNSCKSYDEIATNSVKID